MSEWKLVCEKGCEFLVARDGRVKAAPRYAGNQMKVARLLSPYLNHRGYPVVAQKRGNKRPKVFVHRLVGIAYVLGYFDGATINHKNGIKIDNRDTNLEWITKAENTAHQWETGLVDLSGERHPGSKLTQADVDRIRASRAAGATVAALADLLNVSASTVYKVLQGRRWAS